MRYQRHECVAGDTQHVPTHLTHTFTPRTNAHALAHSLTHLGARSGDALEGTTRNVAHTVTGPSWSCAVIAQTTSPLAGAADAKLFVGGGRSAPPCREGDDALCADDPSSPAITYVLPPLASPPPSTLLPSARISPARPGEAVPSSATVSEKCAMGAARNAAATGSRRALSCLLYRDW